MIQIADSKFPRPKTGGKMAPLEEDTSMCFKRLPRALANSRLNSVAPFLLLFFILCPSLLAIPQKDKGGTVTSKMQMLLEKSAFVFKGTVKELKAVTMAIVPVSE